MACICPHCKNPISDDDALSCMYCGESLERDIGVFGKLKYSKTNIHFIIIALLLLSLFLVFIL